MSTDAEGLRYPVEIHTEIVASLTGATADAGPQALSGAIRAYPNDGDYLLSLGTEQGDPLGLHGGLPVLAGIAVPLFTHPSPFVGALPQQDAGGTQTDQPTDQPTDRPTDTPTDRPTDRPTDTPTDRPTDTPTDQPTDRPTDTPTDRPTDQPLDQPSPQSARPLPISTNALAGTNLLDIALGEYSFDVEIYIPGGVVQSKGTVARVSQNGFRADVSVAAKAPVGSSSDLVRLLPCATLLSADGNAAMTLFGTVHFMTADGEVVATELSGRLEFAQTQDIPDYPLYFAHWFGPALLGHNPVTLSAEGQTRGVPFAGARE